ncbi:hypothetical protein ACM26E_16245, partial [Kluyvera cryocrescens]
AVNDFMDSVHHIWCPLSSQEYQDLPDGAETTLTDDLKKSALALSIPPWTSRMLLRQTITQHWQCMLCGKCYLGTKQCPGCNDWTSTIPHTT